MDNRVVLVTLTAEGGALVERMPLKGLPLLRRELQSLPPERLALMYDILFEIQTLMQGENAE